MAETKRREKRKCETDDSRVGQKEVGLRRTKVMRSEPLTGSELSLYQILQKLSLESHRKIQTLLNDRDDKVFNKWHKTLSMLTLRMCSPPGSKRTPDILCGEFVHEKLKPVVKKEMEEGSYEITNELNDFAIEFAKELCQ
jgi:hypothetical protein